jgi:ABC-type transport system involved in multi-copper enzyme maturation permease subunit
MRYFFLLLGLFLIISSALMLFVKPPGQPTPMGLLGMMVMLGGFVILGIAQILKELARRPT